MCFFWIGMERGGPHRLEAEAPPLHIPARCSAVRVRLVSFGRESLESLPIGSSSSLLGLPCRILHMNPKKELLWSL